MSSIEEQAAKQDFDTQSRMSFGPANTRSKYAAHASASVAAASVSASLAASRPDSHMTGSDTRRDSLDSHFTSVSQRKPASANMAPSMSALLNAAAAANSVGLRNASSLLSSPSTRSILSRKENLNRYGNPLIQTQVSAPLISQSNVFSNQVLSEIEAIILRSHEPVTVSETEEIEVLGQRGIWVNKSEVSDWRGEVPIEHYHINEDPNPEIITKRSQQKLEYIQELAVRYLRPPTPPAPGEIVITQEANVLTPPAPPLVIRQQPARPLTPEPLIIREAPPQAPNPVGRKLITISGKRLPPAPRKVVIERFAPLPAKPQSVLIERWLPYNEVKRRVIFQAAPPDPIVIKPRNTIVQWESPKVEIRKDFKYLGIVKANPADYVQRYGPSLKSAHDLPEFVFDIKSPDGIVLAADYKPPLVHELEGDLHALKLINLELEGLGAYKNYFEAPQSVTSYGISSVRDQPINQVNGSFNGNSAVSGLVLAGPGSGLGLGLGVSSSGSVLASTSDSIFDTNNALSELITQIFHTIDRNNNGRINVEDAEKTLLRLNSRLGRDYGENDVRAFFMALDANNDGTLSLDEFKRAFLNITN